MIRVSCSPGEWRVAVLEPDGTLLDYAIDRPGRPDGVGDVVRGRVIAHVPAMAGAFVALPDAEGFLPDSAGAAGLGAGDAVRIRITRAAQGGKGPRLTADGVTEAGPPALIARGPCAALRLAALHPDLSVLVDDPAVAALWRGTLGDRLRPGGFDDRTEAQVDALMTVIADKLDRPLGLALGPDGRVYVGEAGRIWRTRVALPIAQEPVLDHLPDDGAHPLKEIAFAPGGRMFVNVGSSSDACRDAASALPMPCPDLVGATPRAAVYEAVLGGPDLTVQSFKPYATGLRNSLALAWVAEPGVLLQGENSVDYRDDDAPNEELNRLVAGKRYGWPYCVGAKQAARGYESRVDCAKTEAPALLWPAHVAPLQMVSVPSDAKNAFAGQLVVAWHGYRAGGHRIASFALDATGRPSGPARMWIDGWAARGKGRPLGTPAGFTIDSTGRLLVVEDRNRTLLMLVRDPATAQPAATIR